MVALVFFYPPPNMFYSRPKIASSLNPHSLTYMSIYITVWFLPDLVSLVSNSEFVNLKSLKMNFPSCQLNVNSLFIDLPSSFSSVYTPTTPTTSIKGSVINPELTYTYLPSIRNSN